MKQWYIVTITLLLFSAVIFSQPTEVEPNNTASQANIIQIEDSILASINYTGDVDYFKFTTSFNEDTLQIVIRNINNSNLSGYVMIFDTAGTTIAMDYYDKIGMTLTFVAQQKGAYYIRAANDWNGFPNKVRKSRGFGLTGEYLLQLKKFVPSAPLVNHFIPFDSYYSQTRAQVGFYSNGLNTTVLLSNGTDIFNIPDTINSWSIKNLNGWISNLNPGATYILKGEAKNDSGVSSLTFNFTAPAKPDFWEIKNLNSTELFNDLSFIDFANERFGIIFGYYRFYKTYNGGDTWTSYENNKHFYCGYAIDSLNIIAGSLDQGIFKTTNGGLEWNSVSSHPSNVKNILFVNASIGFAIGTFGVILKTTTGGESWFEVTSGVGDFLNTICFPDERNGWIAGMNGVVLRTSDGGNNWHQQNIPTQEDLYSITFLDSLRGFALAYYTLLSTTDGGFTWLKKDLDHLYIDISFINNYGCMVGDKGIISLSTDSGETWNAQNSGTYNQLHLLTTTGSQWVAVGSCFPDFIGGNSSQYVNYGSILKSKYNLVNVDDKKEILLTFLINQNYPNPFNPSTIIRYSIPERSFVSMKVYDLLGRVVKVLINEELIPGYYEYEFNASGLSSGVYFYRVQTGSFTETKKMILLR